MRTPGSGSQASACNAVAGAAVFSATRRRVYMWLSPARRRSIAGGAATLLAASQRAFSSRLRATAAAVCRGTFNP